MADRIRVLLVDSDEAFLEPLQFVLAQSGYETYVARDGNAAMAMVEQTSPDLMVIEAVLPRRSGFAVLENLGPLSFPVIVTTNSMAQGQKQWADRLGSFDFFRKPFAMNALVDAIERALKGCCSSGAIESVAKTFGGAPIFAHKPMLTELTA